MKTAGAFSPRSCIKLLVLVGCTAVLATGCWSYRDVEDRAVVLALGMDALSDGFELVAQVALPGGASSGALQGVDGGKAGKPVWVVSAEGDSLEEASRNLQTRVPRELYWGHVRILVIGDRLARQGISPIIEAIGRDPSFRLTTWVVISPSPIASLLSARIPLGTIPAISLAELRKSYTNYTPNLKEVWRTLLDPGIDPAIPFFTSLPAPKGGMDMSTGSPAEAVQIDGLVLFRSDRRVGMLDLQSTMGFLFLTSRLDRGVVTLPCPSASVADNDSPGKHVSMQVRHGQSQVRVLPGHPPQLRVDMTGVGLIIETEGCPIDVSKPEGFNLVEQKMNEEIQRLAVSVVQQAKAVQADVFGFGDAVHRADPVGWSLQAERWHDVFKDLPVEVHARIKLRLTGTTK